MSSRLTWNMVPSRDLLATPGLFATMLALSLAACASGPDSGTPDPTRYNDPGTGPWETVPRASLVEECGLDPDMLDTIDETATYSYAIVRYGKLCHEFYPPGEPGRDEPSDNYSATKTLSAAFFGRVEQLSAGLERPLRDTDLMTDWVDDVTFNPTARVAHVFAMVGYNTSLAEGDREYSYDGSGAREINRLPDVVASIMARNPGHFGSAQTVDELAETEFFDRLGMENSTWDAENFAVSWRSTIRDMARVGILLAHDGFYDEQQLLSREWVYKMSHPAFEDANTGIGYLTWVVAERNYRINRRPLERLEPFGECQPAAVWPEYPHGLSESMDCGYDGLYACEQRYDVGVFGGFGFGGQMFVVHRALDLVLVTRNAGDDSFLTTPWDLIRPALVAHDPMFQGDEAAFCEAYRAGSYAPDLIVP